jgi:thiosulfate/3-mercaptopyruvate sulfurtransferase
MVGGGKNSGRAGRARNRAETMVTSLYRVALGALAAVAFAASAQASDYLVTTDWLEANLEADGIRIVEVSVNPGVFERGHIPGAVNFVWHTDLVDPVRRDIATPDNFQQLLRTAGIDDDTTVILYGDTNNWFAAWGAWVFDVYGVDNVKLLDGGRALWEAEGRPLSTRPASHAEGTITIGEPNRALRAHLPDVVAASESGSHAIIDIRSPDEYSGAIIAPEGMKETAIRAGHVPGAINVPWVHAVDEQGRFKSADALRALYAEGGVDGSKPIITYCRIGERSSHTWFALTKILGYDAANYDGSWTEYGNAVGVPIANLAGTVWTGQ